MTHWKGVAISGKAGAGKNALAGLVCRELRQRRFNVEKIAFGDGIKYAVALRYGLGPEDKAEGRKYMVEIGEEARSSDPLYWVKALEFRAKDIWSRGSLICITDLRLANELQWCRSNDLLTVRLDATACDRGTRLAQRGESYDYAFSTHPTEVELDMETFHHRLHNPHAGLFALERLAAFVVDDFTGAVEVR
jgi:hypothetical protein